MGSLRYPFGGDHPSQTTHQALSFCKKLEPKQPKGGISTSTPDTLACTIHRLPPILHINCPNPMLSCSKGSRGLSVPLRVSGIFTIRAGRNLPDKEFRYLRTVIVTAAVYRGFNSMLRLHFHSNLHPLLTFRHRAGVRPYSSSCDFAKPCVFGKQSPGPFHCAHFRGAPSPEVTGLFCRIP